MNNENDLDLENKVKILLARSVKDNTIEFSEIPEINGVKTDEKAMNGKFNMQISDDQIRVTGNFYAPRGSGKPIDYSDVIERLHDMNVVDSVINIKKIKGILQYINDRGQNIENTIIATGKVPVNEIPDHIKIVFDPEDYITLINKIIEEDKNHKIDYKKFSRLCILNEGMKVAQKYKNVKGENGLTVKGEVIHFITERKDDAIIGSNLKMDQSGAITTSCVGEFIYKNNEISINDILVLKEGVNFKTGNIHFPGTVVIHGEIETDFEIHTDKNLFVHNTLGAAKVYSGGNLIVDNGGIVGNGNHKIEVENIVKSVHLENVRIESGNNIFIEKSAYHSQIFTNGILHMGNNSKLLDCKISAKNGLIVHDIGNESNIKTQITCGVDYKISEDINLVKKYKKKLSDSLDEILKRDPMAETWEINKQIEQCDLGIEQILSDADYNWDARINVNGTIFCGTEINICNYKFEVTKDLSYGFFYYNKKDDAIKFQNH